MGPTARRRLAAALAASAAAAALAVGGGPAALSAAGEPSKATDVADGPFTSGSGGGDAVVAPAARVRTAQAQDALAAARRAAARQTAPPRAAIAVVTGDAVAVRDRPGGRVALRLAATTEFGTARRLGVVERRGRWLGVTVPDLPNGTLGWVDARGGAVRIERTRWSLHADLSDRTLLLRRDGRPVRRITVAIGTPSSPTPTGRFAVTDKLDGTAYGPYYGCCVLALSATQPNLPAGWTGGNRMAIHGTDAPDTIGAAASAGCLRAADDDLRALMDRVPVGTPVVIGR
ncbi:MAG: L,D-transpeptidase [Solirubrobacterales bacterium]|nr:L,D-transpeptidase [Solirubrobacterales bacterium]